MVATVVGSGIEIDLTFGEHGPIPAFVVGIHPHIDERGPRAAVGIEMDLDLDEIDQLVGFAIEV
jgi:hypothetical protein